MWYSVMWTTRSDSWKAKLQQGKKYLKQSRGYWEILENKVGNETSSSGCKQEYNDAMSTSWFYVHA